MCCKPLKKDGLHCGWFSKTHELSGSRLSGIAWTVTSALPIVIVCLPRNKLIGPAAIVLQVQPFSGLLGRRWIKTFRTDAQ